MRARKAGRPFKHDQPSSDQSLRENICELHKQGLSVRKILVELGHPVGQSTARKIIMQDVYNRAEF